MALYKVVVDQKITRKVLAVVEANSSSEATDKASSGDVVSFESTLDFQIDEYIPLGVEKYQ